MNTYIIYHGTGCSDGLTSAAIFDHWINKHDFQNKGKYHFIAGHFQMTAEELPDFTESIVYFLDFSFKKDLFKHVLTTASKTFLIDHHKSAYQELKEFIENSDKYNLKVIFDLNECGSSLTWMYLFPNKPLPLVIKHIKDRDIWIWKEEKSREYLSYIDLVPLTLQDYKTHYNMVLNLVSTDFFLYYDKAIKLGAILMKQKVNLVEPIIKNVRYCSLIDFCISFKKGFKDVLNENIINENIESFNMFAFPVNGVAISNTPSLFVNNVSEALIDTNTSLLLISYVFGKDGIRFSIRSNKHINSIAVAKLIDDKAGGHQTASGAFITWDDWNNIHIKQQTPLFKLLNTY